jgi:L-alanine-DL-glutamate epimerase-like enolase superfamily enzyme
MVDVNQGWDIDTACREAPYFAALGATWIEEPIAADRPEAEWQRLAGTAGTALAGGENLAGKAFEIAIDGGWLGVIQPDICKWGGFSGCRQVARAALDRGRRFCPHFLGGGIGLVASAHLLAAIGGDGMLELDINPNPLREALAVPFPAKARGKITLGSDAGLGVRPDLDAVAEWRVDAVGLG